MPCVATFAVMRPYTSVIRSPVFLVLSTGRQRQSSLRSAILAKKPFVAGLICGRSCPASPHQRPNAFILIHVAERIFAARAASSTTYLSQPSVATTIGADVAIVARNHRGDASTRRQSYSLPRNRVAPTL